MGLDGGTIPSRADLLRRASWRLASAENRNTRSTRGGDVTIKEEFTSQTQLLEMARVKWLLCALSGDPLQPPIVADELGKVYNREAVIEFLLGIKKFEYSKEELKQKGFGHLVSTKSVFDLHLKENPLYSEWKKKSVSSGEYTVDPPAYFICPVTNHETNGRYPFVALRPCGHVFTEKAINQLKERNCYECGKSFEKDDVIALNPTEEQLQQLQQRLKRKSEEKKKTKKEKKAKRAKTEETKDQNSKLTKQEIAS